VKIKLSADAIGWIGNIGFVLGAYLVAHKRIEYFYLHMFGNACWIIAGIKKKLPSLVAISIFLFVLAAYGAYKWLVG
jgi:hypothetical protein